MGETLIPSPGEEKEPRSTVEDLTVIAGVEKSYQTGEMGPLIASRAISKKEPDLALRKFEIVFGRDSLHTAYDLLEFYPKLTESTLKRLAELQGTKDDSVTEEEPGRIHHEHRTEENPWFEKLRSRWGHPEDKELIYYGTVDATPLYVKLFCDYLQKTNDWELLDEKIKNKDGEEISLREAFERAVDWIFQKIDRSEFGFVEFQRTNPRGIGNQIRKDSWDGLSHKDGELANHNQPVAAVEVQGYSYDALLGAVEVFERFAENNPEYQDKADECRKRAEKIKKNLIEQMWMEDEEYFAIGIDRDTEGNPRQLDTITSNPGHLLDSKIFDDPEMQTYREAIIKKLFSDDMFCVAGIRTLSSREIRYGPGTYCNGSVWPMDNEMIAKGLERQGYLALATEVRLRNHWGAFIVRKNPEFFRGDEGQDGEGKPIPLINTKKIREYSKERGREITIETVPQEIQAWTVSAILSTKRKLGEGLMRKVRDRERIEFEEDILEDLREQRQEGLLIEKDLKKLFRFRK